MAFQISEFTNALQQDGARPNLFQVVMTGLPNNAGASGQPFSFLCKAAQLPGSTLGTVPLYYFGREAKYAGNRTFADWTVTVINDESFSVRNSIETWMNSINSNAGNVRSSTTPVTGGGSGGQAYAINATVNQYGKTGNTGTDGVIKSYGFVGMFPVDLSPIDLDWGTNDSIEEFSVTFAYQYWTSNTTS